MWLLTRILARLASAVFSISPDKTAVGTISTMQVRSCFIRLQRYFKHVDHCHTEKESERETETEREIKD